MVITVSCPACASSFPVDSKKIPEAGVNARCSSCGQIFRIERPQESAPPPAPEAEPQADFAAAPPAPEPEPEPEAAPEPEPEPLPTFDTEPMEVEGSSVVDRSLEAEADFSVGVDAPSAEDASGDWVFERDADIDPGSLDIQPMETVESSVAQARDESAFFGGPPAVETPAEPEPSFEAPEPEPAFQEPEPEPEPEPVFEAPAPEPEPAAPEPEPAAPAAPAVGGFTFGKRDPKEKARRLARVLVSDMIMYNPERHERALANGTLKEDFEDEIGKSWKEYVEQVGEEMATENPFWAEALNDVLAKGQQIF